MTLLQFSRDGEGLLRSPAGDWVDDSPTPLRTILGLWALKLTITLP